MWNKKKIRIIALVIIIATLFHFGTAIAGSEAQSDGEPLIVAIKAIPPFVIIEDERITGFSIDLWEKIAQQMDKANWDLDAFQTMYEERIAG